MNWSELGADGVTVLVLVLLEGLLSGDNALVLAVIVLPLPEHQQRKALQYGLLGAFVLRIIATLLAVWLVRLDWVSLLGGLYLLWLPYKHFSQHPDESSAGAPKPIKRLLGLSAFWTVVVQADVVDLVFAVDSILAAVGFTKKQWVIITGGLLGILMMRLLTVQVLELVKRYPRLIDGAYVVVSWVGVKLLWEYAHHKHWVPFGINQWWSIGVVLVLFTGAFLYARHAALSPALSQSVDETERMLTPEVEPESARSDGPLAP